MTKPGFRTHSKEDPVAGRAGLVGTQNIRNNQSRVGGLDHIVKDGTIIEAVDNQPWSGEANVHVSIVNWVKTREPRLLPKKRKLWHKVDPPKERTRIRKRGEGPAAKDFEVKAQECEVINSALSSEADLTGAVVLSSNTKPQRCFQGVIPGYDGFVIDRERAKELIRIDSASKKVIRPFLIGRDIVTGDGAPTRYVIDLTGCDGISIHRFKSASNHVKKYVLPQVLAKAESPSARNVSGRKEHIEKWWEMWRPRVKMKRELAKLRRFIVCSGVTKRPIFIFVSNSILPDHATFAFVFQDDYSFGILQSNTHWQWFVAKCSKLTERFRYTPESVFDTFPWPQKPKAKLVRTVAAAGRKVRKVREAALTKVEGGLRAVYRTLELPGKNPLKDAHAELDEAVLAAYGFSKKGDLLQQLLDLNIQVAEHIDRGVPVTSPGIPPDYPTPDDLITEDCIRP